MDTNSPRARPGRSFRGWLALIFLGYGSSFIFALLILGVPWAHSTPRNIGFMPTFIIDALARIGGADVSMLNWLQYAFPWIGLLYLVAQLELLVDRNPLNVERTGLDNVMSIIPGIIGILVLAFAAIVPTIFTPEGVLIQEFIVIGFWTSIAWVDFYYGMILAQKIVVSTYGREENRPQSH